MKSGDIIRLTHLQTKKYLHSHLHQSPLTKQQEVSAYGDGEGDTGDNWKIEVLGKEMWEREGKVRLVHVDTGKYLSSNKNKFPDPIPGQQEVCAISYANSETEWIAEVG